MRGKKVFSIIPRNHNCDLLNSINNDDLKALIIIVTVLGVLSDCIKMKDAINVAFESEDGVALT